MHCGTRPAPAIAGPQPARPARTTAPRTTCNTPYAAEIDNLQRLASRLADGSLDRTTIDAAAATLAASRPLPVLGLRTAAPLAAYFGYFAAKVLPEVHVLDHGGSVLTDQLEQARAAGATAMLGIVLPRHPRESLAALREAHAVGLTVVALTDSPIGEVADAADLTLHARVEPTPGFRSPRRTDGAGDGAAAGHLRCHAGPDSGSARSLRRLGGPTRPVSQLTQL